MERLDERAILITPLWQKKMTMLVPREYGFFCGFIIAVILIFTRNMFIGLPVGAVFWFIGMIAAKIDPDFFGIIYTRFAKIGFTKGPFSGNEYLP